MVNAQVKVFHPAIGRPLLAALIFDILWLVGTGTGGVHYYIRFEKRPEHLVRDFVVLKKRVETFVYGGIGHLHEVNQQVEVFQACRIALVSQVYCFLPYSPSPPDMYRQIPDPVRPPRPNYIPRPSTYELRSSLGENLSQKTGGMQISPRFVLHH